MNRRGFLATLAALPFVRELPAAKAYVRRYEMRTFAMRIPLPREAVGDYENAVAIMGRRCARSADQMALEILEANFK